MKHVRLVLATTQAASFNLEIGADMSRQPAFKGKVGKPTGACSSFLAPITAKRLML